MIIGSGQLVQDLDITSAGKKFPENQADGRRFLFINDILFIHNLITVWGSATQELALGSVGFQLCLHFFGQVPGIERSLANHDGFHELALRSGVDGLGSVFISQTQ